MGSFDYGRNYGVIYDVEAWTDMLPVFGGDSYTWTDNFMAGRANGVATYRNSDFFGLVEGLNFALQYQGNNEGSNAGEIKKVLKMVTKTFASRTVMVLVFPLHMTLTSV